MRFTKDQHIQICAMCSAITAVFMHDKSVYVTHRITSSMRIQTIYWRKSLVIYIFVMEMSNRICVTRSACLSYSYSTDVHFSAAITCNLKQSNFVCNINNTKQRTHHKPEGTYLLRSGVNLILRFYHANSHGFTKWKKNRLQIWP